MGKRVELSVNEMLEMRERGMSNYDIAHSLGIGMSTVSRRIGGQGGRMGRLEAFQGEDEDLKRTKATTKELTSVVRTQVLIEKLSTTDNMELTIDYTNRAVDFGNGFVVPFKSLRSFVAIVAKAANNITSHMEGK